MSMRRGSSALQVRGGFTLIELIVVLLILSLLAAVIVPVVTERADQADPTRVATDLANIRTGAELFHMDVRPRYAGDIEDLTTAIVTGGVDRGVDSVAYPSAGVVAKWDGPYLDISIVDNSVAGTGAGGEIQDAFAVYDAAANTRVAAASIAAW
ncbi:MAG: prepilin-type N-terminal cleavage/methylation domain-containing protein, partial [Gemmatimonadota bacterium]